MSRPAGYAVMMAMALAVIACGGIDAAMARGGAASIMDSPGYQRRLQESRGYVTNQSGSLFSAAPPAQPAPAIRVRKRRHHR
jgi:hypothetical protein